MHCNSFQKRNSGDFWIMLVLRINNFEEEINAPRNFQILLWYKLIVCCILLYRVLYRLSIHSRWLCRIDLHTHIYSIHKHTYIYTQFTHTHIYIYSIYTNTHLYILNLHTHTYIYSIYTHTYVLNTHTPMYIYKHT